MTSFAVVMMMLALTPACGPEVTPKADYKVAKASGTLKFNGKPAPDIYIVLTPTGQTKGNGATTRTDAEGKFVLKDRRAPDGVAPGPYKVHFATRMMADGSDVQGKTLPQLPMELTSAELTTITKTVPEGGGTVDIDITDPRIK